METMEVVFIKRGKRRVLLVTFGLILATSLIFVACNKDEPIKEAGQKKDKLILKMASPNYLSEVDSVDVERFEFLYPNIDIQLTDYSGWFHKTEDLQNYNKKLNLDLLAGVPIDLIEVSSINIDRYVDKNYLMELNDFMDNDDRFIIEQYFPKIMENIRYGDRYFYLPREIYPIVYYINEEETKKLNWEVEDHYMSWEHFYDYVTALEESGESNYVFLRQEYANFIMNLIQCNFDAFRTEDNYIEMDALIPMLKEIEDLDKLTHPYAKNVFSTRDVDKVVMHNHEYLEPEFYSIAKMIMGTRDIDFVRAPILNDDTELYPYSMHYAYAISSFTEHEEETWLLLRHITTYRNKKECEALSNRRLNFAEMEAYYNRYKVDKYNGILIPRVEEKEYHDMMDFYDNLNYLVQMDVVIENLIMEEIEKYISGSITVEDMIQNIENKVNIYMNE